MENVNYILDKGLRDAHVKAKRRRGKDTSSVARSWKRIRALPDLYDSEEDATVSGGPAQAEAMAAARALVMLSSLKPCPWEMSDWGEEAANLASGVRKMRRRTERWENGTQVVRRRDGPGGEDVPVPSRDYEDEMMDMERSSLPDMEREEEDEDEMEYEGEEGPEYANGHEHRRASIMA